MGIDGRSIVSIFTNGWKRKVQEANGQGSLGVTIPSEFADDNDVTKGDNVVLQVPDDGECDLEMHFDTDE